MKITIFDPIRRQLELAEVERDLQEALADHYRSQYATLKEKATKLAVAKRNERKKLEDRLKAQEIHLKLMLVLLGELLITTALGLSR